MTKGQHALKDIKENINSIDDKYGFNVNSEIDEIKDDCNIIEKELKAVEILKIYFPDFPEKKAIGVFDIIFFEQKYPEEYKILKEVFKNDNI